MLERSRRACVALVTLVLAVTSANARAEDAPQSPAAAVAPPAAPVNRTPYEAFVDIGFKSLYDGDLALAEEAFRQAAALPGDPVRSSIAASFAERAAHLRASPDNENGSPPEPGNRLSRTAPATPPARSDGARTTLIASTSLLGLGLYGWSLPATFGLTVGEDKNAFVGLYLMTAGAAALVPALATAEVTPAQANLAFYGGTRGMWHGALLAAALFGNLGPDRQYRLWAGILLAGSVVFL